MNYLQFDFETITDEQLEQLVALLNEQGFEGFEEDEDGLKAYIAEDRFEENEFSRVLDLFSEIAYTRTVVEHINWNQKWEQDFKPVLIDHFVGIRAEFHAPLTGVEHEIIITPKMSFGTGHHATTHLMVQLMKELDFHGKSVLDFGTGTGVLAILAEKCGANAVMAIDYDEWSIINASENIDKNECKMIKTAIMSEIPGENQFDIILANINLNVLVANVLAVKEAIVPSGFVLLSGLLKENEFIMRDTLAQAGLKYVSTHQRGDWIAILAQK